MRDFKKYEVWKIGHEFVMEVYSLTNNFPKGEQFGITSQIRRASVSIPTNIAEGCGRKTDPDFARFLHISLGSAHEVEYLLMLCRDLTYLHEAQYLLFDQKINMIKRKLYQLEKTINKSL